MKIDLAEQKIEEVAQSLGERLATVIGSQLAAQVGHFQQCADEAQNRANEAAQTLSALEGRIGLARTELSDLETRLQEKQSAYKQLYG